MAEGMDSFMRALAPQQAPLAPSPQRRETLHMLAQILAANAQTMQSLATSVTAAVRAMQAPKRIVRDARGRPIGIQPGR